MSVSNPNQPESQACEDCPLVSALDSAESLLLATEHIGDNERKRALGGIVMTRETLKKVAARDHCTQRQEGMNREPKCPLIDVVMLTRTLAFAPWPSSQFTINLDEVGRQITESFPEQPDRHRPPGQYL